MLTVRLDPEMEQFLETLSRETHRPKSFYVKEALRQYIEDMEDYHEALKRSTDESKNLLTPEQLEKALGL